MIRTFKDKETRKLFAAGRSKVAQEVQTVARRKLEQLNAAAVLVDLTIFPGNNLEALKG